MIMIARTESGWRLRLDEDTEEYFVTGPDNDEVMRVDYDTLLEIGVLFRKSVQTAIENGTVEG